MQGLATVSGISSSADEFLKFISRGLIFANSHFSNISRNFIHAKINPRKVINKKVPQSIGESFTLMSHSHNTRTNNPLVVPYSNTDSYGTYSIRNQCITAWNVYSEIFADKDLESLSNSVVKGLITTHFLNSYLT